MFETQLADVVHWQSSQPLGMVLVLVVQLGLVTLVAWGLSRLVSRLDPSRTHGIWLTATLLCLALPSLHALQMGWRVSVALPTVNNARPISRQAVLERPSVPAPLERNLTEVNLTDAMAVLDAEESKIGDWLSEPETDALGEAHSSASTVTIIDTVEPRDIAKRRISQLPASSMPSAPFWPRLTWGLTGVYLAGLIVFASRLFYAMIRLRLMRRHAVPAGKQTFDEAAGIAALIGLPSVPDVRLSDQVAIPLVCGYWRPVIMLPSGFECWTLEERRSALLHELTHVRRQDVLYRYVSAINRAVYWFHPVSRILDRHLSESREWATDREVIQQTPKLGLNANQYADSLLSIVARACHSHSFSDPVVAMSANDDMELRLRLIMGARIGPRRSGVHIARVSILLLVLCTGFSAVRLQVAKAQPPTNRAATKSSTPAATDNIPANADPNEPAVKAAKSDTEPNFTLATVAPGDENFWNKIRDASVAEPGNRETAFAMVNASGTIVGDNGQPVADAVVLLRESSIVRLNRDIRNVVSDEELYLWQVHDVLAKTTSDDEGHFVFRDIVVPKFEGPQYGAWNGDIVAAHEQRGIGYLTLGCKEEKRQHFESLSIKLHQTRSIEGRLVSTDQNPISGAIVNLTQIIRPGSDQFFPTRNMELRGSQITPRARTDDDGRFRFSQIPSSLIALLGVYDTNSEGASAAIATSEDVSTYQEQNSPFLRDQQISRSPITIVADPGVMINGQIVDESGEPVANAKVRFAGLIKHFPSDKDGRVHLRVATARLTTYRDRFRSEGSASVPLTISTDARQGYLPRTVNVPIDDIDFGKAFQATLIKGVRVSGTVMDDDGTPLSGIGVRVDVARGTPSLSSQTKDDGRFELLLPADKHVLHFFSERSDVTLPNRRETFQLKEPFDGNFTRTVDLADGQPCAIEPVIVPKANAVTVVVSLPDGSPARDANAIIRDMQIREIGSGIPPRTEVIEKSAAVLTNSLGRAELIPKGVLSESARIDFSLVQSGSVFNATAKISSATNGVLAVVLSEAPVLEGRVLIDGRGVEGARVSAGESHPAGRKTANGSGGAFSTSNPQIVETDEKGTYRIPILRNRRYSINVQSIPYENSRLWIGYSASSSGPGVIKVRDFALYRSKQEILGKVVDADGAPVADASVHILRDSNTQPDLWIGHNQSSQRTTDAEGRFRLSCIPSGSYRIVVSGKRSPDSSSRSSLTTVTGKSGDTNLVIRLVDDSSAKPLPRLKPVRIEPVPRKP